MAYREPHNQEPEPEVVVGIYDAPHDAHLAILHLETLGIPARTLNELVVGMAPHLGGGFAGIRVLVPQELARDAHAALEALRLELKRERRKRGLAATETKGTPEWSRIGALLVVGALMLGWYLVR